MAKFYTQGFTRLEIKMLSRLGSCLGLARWVTNVLIRDTHSRKQTQKRDYLMTGQRSELCSYEPRNVPSHQKLG